MKFSSDTPYLTLAEHPFDVVFASESDDFRQQKLMRRDKHRSVVVAWQDIDVLRQKLLFLTAPRCLDYTCFHDSSITYR